MNNREALIALAEGKKIRKQWWAEGGYIFLDEKRDTIVDEHRNMLVGNCFDETHDWELYPEPNAPISLEEKVNDLIRLKGLEIYPGGIYSGSNPRWFYEKYKEIIND